MDGNGQSEFQRLGVITLGTAALAGTVLPTSFLLLMFIELAALLECCF